MYSQNSEGLDSSKEERRKIDEVFAQYLAPDTLDALSKPPGLTLGGSETTASVIATDIRRYAEITYEHKPSRVVEVLNEYYQIVVDAVLANRGVLDKFMGDRCLAFFNGPDATPDFLGRSVRAALQIKTNIGILNQRCASSTPYPLRVGIGLTVGPVWLGNVGAKERREYTIIGSTTNLAFHLAKLSQETRILTTEEVVKSLEMQVRKISIGEVQLPNRIKIAVYELSQISES